MQHVLLEVLDWGDWTVCCRSPRRVELPLARQPGIDRPGLHNGQQLPCDVEYLSSWSPTRHWTRSAVWRERRSVDSAWSFMPWRSSTLMTCSNCAHLTMTSRTSSLMESLSVTVTPSILSNVTRSMPGKHGGRLKARLLRRLSVTIIYLDFWRLSVR